MDAFNAGAAIANNVLDLYENSPIGSDKFRILLTDEVLSNDQILTLAYDIYVALDAAEAKGELSAIYALEAMRSAAFGVQNDDLRLSHTLWSARYAAAWAGPERYKSEVAYQQGILEDVCS
jgi:hypothetical protein